MPGIPHTCKLACVERAAGLVPAGDQQRNIDMTTRGVSLAEDAGAVEAGLIGPVLRGHLEVFHTVRRD